MSIQHQLLDKMNLYYNVDFRIFIMLFMYNPDYSDFSKLSIGNKLL